MKEICNGCKNPMDHSIKHIIAYVNGKEIYSKYCTVCTKQHWIDFRDTNHELFKSLTKNQQQ